MLKTLILLAAGVATTLVGAEVALRALPIPNGGGAAEPSEKWPTRRLIPGNDITMSFGWDMQHVSHGKANADGFSSPFDYKDGASVGAVIGDSYVEGLSTAEDKRLSAELAKTMGQPTDTVYNFGISGTSLPHYLGIANLIGPRYRLKWATVIITDRDFEEGFAAQPGFYHWGKGDGADLVSYTPSKTHDAASNVVRGTALYRYIKLNLKFVPKSLVASGFEGENAGGGHGCPPASLSAQDRHLLGRWTDRMADALHLPAPRVALVFDSNRDRFNRPGTGAGCPTRDLLARQWLAQDAARKGYAVVDAAPVFEKAWSRDHIPFDHWPLDRHWTSYTNKLVAESIADALRQGGRPAGQ